MRQHNNIMFYFIQKPGRYYIFICIACFNGRYWLVGNNMKVKQFRQTFKKKKNNQQQDFMKVKI